MTYAELADLAGRFAGALRRAEIDPGSGVATLLGRVPELFVAALGTLRAGSLYAPLFSAFGPEPIVQRLQLGSIRVLVTTPTLLRRKVVGVLDRVPALERIVLVDGADEPAYVIERPGGPPVRVESFEEFLRDAPCEGPTATTVDSPALLHFTSGTTGEPKGAVHVHGAIVAHHATARAVFGLHTGDTYWCTADPGWVTGTSYGILAPLAHGVTTIVDDGAFDAARWYQVLADHRVDVWYTAPTALRMLQRAAVPDLPSFDALRLVGSVGEPLDAASVVWARETFGVPVLDTWWQTETGCIMIANTIAIDVRPGSMGHPVPGVHAALLERTADGELVLDDRGEPRQVDTGVSGEIAIEVGWPSMFRTYLDREDRYRACFVGSSPHWYRSGDLARRDDDGYFWFIGRGDDVIKTAGHLIGPFEVESVLDDHPAVVESGVIGIPDETAGSVIKAFVVLHTGVEASDELRAELIAHCRRHLGAAVAPREIEIAASLPHTRSGKIVRRVLAARERGEDAGDTSTLETEGA